MSKFQVVEGFQIHKAFGKWSAATSIQIQRIVSVWIQIAGRYSLSENLDLCTSQVNELMPASLLTRGEKGRLGGSWFSRLGWEPEPASLPLRLQMIDKTCALGNLCKGDSVVFLSDLPISP